jgi:transposase
MKMHTIEDAKKEHEANLLEREMEKNLTPCYKCGVVGVRVEHKTGYDIDRDEDIAAEHVNTQRDELCTFYRYRCTTYHCGVDTPFCDDLIKAAEAWNEMNKRHAAEEREVNARLITEAPELYEAAVEILASSWGSHDQRLIDGMKRLRAAVDRVKGETT